MNTVCPRCARMRASSSAKVVTRSGAIVPTQLVALAMASTAAGLSTLIDPSASTSSPPPCELTHSSALHVSPSYEAP